MRKHSRKEIIVTLWLVGSLVVTIVGCITASLVLMGIGFLNLVAVFIYIVLDNAAHASQLSPAETQRNPRSPYMGLNNAAHASQPSPAETQQNYGSPYMVLDNAAYAPQPPPAETQRNPRSPYRKTTLRRWPDW
jgi:hypothetical protein